MSPTFAQLGVPEALCRSLAARGFEQPFAIQAATITDAMTGRDVCGQAPTGSGKTLAFGLPLLAAGARGEPHRPRSLILSPTRELADQIADELRALESDLRIGVVYGGVGYGAQVRQLRTGVDLLVACPGRLEDLISQKLVDLADVDRVVIDEADQMADMGFLPVVRRLLDRTAPRRQIVLFSATLDTEVAALTDAYQHDPARHRVEDDVEDTVPAEHRFLLVDRPDRADVAAQVIDRDWPAVVFCRTRHGADRMARQLNQRGVDAVALHGGHSQNKRTRALERFTAGRAQALVATDVAARGIHVDDVALVVHADPPDEAKVYTHRSGRTARAGRTGLVVSLVAPSQVDEVRRMQRQLDLELPIEALSSTPDKTGRNGRTGRNDGTDQTGRADDTGRNGRTGRNDKTNNGRADNSDRTGGTEGGSAGSGRSGSRGDQATRSSRRRSGGTGQARSRRPGPGRPAGEGTKPEKPGAGAPEGAGPSRSRSGRSGGKARAAKAKPGTKRSGKPRPPNRKAGGGTGARSSGRRRTRGQG
ncbi:MAG: DEAD/DEAH box helicase [Acidimicrobiales bacterium]